MLGFPLHHSFYLLSASEQQAAQPSPPRRGPKRPLGWIRPGSFCLETEVAWPWLRNHGSGRAGWWLHIDCTCRSRGCKTTGLAEAARKERGPGCRVLPLSAKLHSKQTRLPSPWNTMASGQQDCIKPQMCFFLESSSMKIPLRCIKWQPFTECCLWAGHCAKSYNLYMWF